jgi:hypothetical protein
MRAALPLAALLVVSGCSAEPPGSTRLAASPYRAAAARPTLFPSVLPAESPQTVAAAEAFADAESSPPAPGCADSPEVKPSVYAEPGGPKRLFSVDGYLARAVRVSASARSPIEAPDYCLTVLWPPGETNNDGAPSRVARFIGAPWFQLIRNTLARIPPEHAATLRRLVIDNRPTEHGIASHDRQDPDDARDGHTIWLHEHLFRDPNHWARGTRGTYFSYHLSESGRTLDDAPPDHALFSPVLLHEIGHLVMYNVVNASRSGRARAIVPDCARTCIDAGGCRGLSPGEREAGCVTPYCMPFRYRTSTENWAEQYRFFYQSAVTRALLREAGAGCGDVLAEQERSAATGTLPAPWDRGLPDGPEYRRSLWDSCGGKACKGW